MIYLLDTNVCIHLINQRHRAILKRFRTHVPGDIALCSVVRAELLTVARRSGRIEANLQLLKAFFAPLQSLPFDDDCAEHYSQIHADLLNQGTPIGPNDTLIAAIARAHGATLVTHNMREFGRVAGLKMEDWEGV